MPGRRALTAALLSAWLAAALILSAAVSLESRAVAADPDRPNVVFILTDDQTLAEMQALPKTSALIGGGGVTFDRAYVSYPLCCPSRATILTGQYMHNTNVRGNAPPAGGWQVFSALGTEARALPVWMQEAGYRTIHSGKYLNGYPAASPPVPAGWDEWYGKLSQYNPGVFGNEIYFNYGLLEQTPESPQPLVRTYGGAESDYQSDVLADKAVDAIHRFGRPGAEHPFYLNVWFSAPHAPYIAAPRHTGAFDGAAVPRNSAVNERVMRDKARFMRKLRPLRKRQIGFISARQRNRWAQLLSIDDAVESIFEALSREGRLDDTYVIFTSDNGYFSGEHRIAQGKYLPYEPSSHVPLMMRGPGIPAGARSGELVSNADIAPTIAHIGGASPQLTPDGRSLLPFAQNPGLRTSRPVLLEGDTGSSLTATDAVEASVRASEPQATVSRRLRRKKGVKNLEQEPVKRIARAVYAPAYRAIRTDRYLYIHYAGKAGTELYDMALDPLQLNSRARDRRYKPVRDWLAQRLAALEGCAGPACLAEIGPDPAPLATARAKQKKGKKRGERKRPGAKAR